MDCERVVNPEPQRMEWTSSDRSKAPIFCSSRAVRGDLPGPVKGRCKREMADRLRENDIPSEVLC